MAFYLVSYDSQCAKEYNRLVDRLKQLDSLQVLAAHSLVRAAAVAADLLRHVAREERLLVVEVAADSVWRAPYAAEPIMQRWMQQAPAGSGPQSRERVAGG